MKKRCFGYLVLVRASFGLMLTTAAQGAADHSLACPSGIVNLGDSVDLVRTKCGAPSHLSGGKSTAKRSANAGSRKSVSRQGSAKPISANKREVWHYDLGPDQLQRRLHFRGGRLDRIEVGGYGSYAR